jgi:hypothetical protein
MALERQKFEADLVAKAAADADDHVKTARRLVFLHCTGYITLSPQQQRTLEQIAGPLPNPAGPGSLSSTPAAGR